MLIALPPTHTHFKAMSLGCTLYLHRIHTKIGTRPTPDTQKHPSNQPMWPSVPCAIHMGQNEPFHERSRQNKSTGAASCVCTLIITHPYASIIVKIFICMSYPAPYPLTPDPNLNPVLTATFKPHLKPSNRPLKLRGPAHIFFNFIYS